MAQNPQICPFMYSHISKWIMFLVFIQDAVNMVVTTCKRLRIAVSSQSPHLSFNVGVEPHMKPSSNAHCKDGNCVCTMLWMLCSRREWETLLTPTLTMAADCANGMLEHTNMGRYGHSYMCLCVDRDGF